MHVTAIVPAYNEGPRIGAVLAVLNTCDMIDEVVVVDDGSTDETFDVASAHGAHVIKLPINTGKGGAVAKGLDESPSDVVLFLDADLVGLSTDHVRRLLTPVMNGDADMTIGIFEEGRAATDLAQAITPWLSGQRALKRSILDGMHLEISRYGLEAVLTRHAKERNLNVVEVKLPRLTHVTKEEKIGPVKGVAMRMRMYWDVVRSLVHKE